MTAQPVSPDAPAPDGGAPGGGGGGAPRETAADWLTVRVALTAAVVAALMLLWSGWRWWSAPPAEPAAVSPTRLGVLFSPYPVPPAGDSPSDPADRPGLLVTAVDAYGAVRRSGGRVGDVWLSVAGQPLCDGVDPLAAAQRVQIVRGALGPGFAMEVEALHGGTLRRFVVRDDAPPADGVPPYVPVWPRDLPPDRGLMGAELVAVAPVELTALPGVLVGATTPGGPADQAGLRTGDRIVALAPLPPDAEAPADGAQGDEGAAPPAAEPAWTQVATPAEWFAVARDIRPGQTVTLDLRRRGRALSLRVPFVAESELPQIRRRAPLGL
ncbi:hypothetical protein [Alienimonas sp. DA493]|uniref:hypothetical protein n=1 Tax=Alienimonas sp. DA493 TaxID=3373605 RepID=UPI0037552D4A